MRGTKWGEEEGGLWVEREKDSKGGGFFEKFNGQVEFAGESFWCRGRTRFAEIAEKRLEVTG